MKTRFILTLFLLIGILTSCSLISPASAPTTIPSNTPALEFQHPANDPNASATTNQTPSVAPTAQPLSPQQTVLDRAFLVVTALKDKDMNAVSQFVDPQSGLRFSPYANVKSSDQVFSADKVGDLMADPTVYTWGVYDGSGAPISLTFTDYYSKFVYDVDFANAPQIALNHRLGTGNSIDNSQDFYPNSMIVDFYFPGFDPQYNGMDWRSLRLVFSQNNGSWYLVGIIHDQWTI